MSVLSDLVRSWRDPRGLIRERLAEPSEPRALVTLMGACGLMFVAEWPVLARQAALDPSQPFEARIGGALMGVVFALPLIAYAVAGISRLIAHALGGKGSGFGARAALFQALWATSPLVLLYGLVKGVQGAGVAATLLGGLWVAGFLWLWWVMLRMSERGQDV